jgi:Secretion system C-terminal sorting domain
MKIIYGLAVVNLSCSTNSLRTLNIGIATQTVQETNEKIINNIYFRSHGLTTPTLRGSDISALQNIAAQCPTTGGKAVYNARGILAAYKHFHFYLDETNCHAQGAAYRVAKPKTVGKTADKGEKQVRFYPNPTADYFTLEISNATTNATLILTDALGKTVLTQNINAPTTNISTTDLPQGMYFVQLQDTNGFMTVLPKLIITRL